MTTIVSLVFGQGMIFILIGLIVEITIIGLIVSFTTKWLVKKTIQSEFEVNDKLKQKDDVKLKDDIQLMLNQLNHDDSENNSIEELKMEQEKMMRLIQYLVKEQKRGGK